MNFELTETQTLIRDTARKFARERIAPRRAQSSTARSASPPSSTARWRELGLMGVNVPASTAARRPASVAYALAMMEVAARVRVDLGGHGGHQHVRRADRPVRHRGAAQKYVPRLASGEAVAGAFALSEPHAGSRPRRACAPRAVRDGRPLGAQRHQAVDHLRRLRGRDGGLGAHRRRRATRASPPSSSRAARRASSSASTRTRWACAARTPCALTFEDCEIPAENLLGEEGEGFKLAMIALDGGRIGIAARRCGVGARGARGVDRVREGPQGLRPAHRRVPGASA